MSYHSVEVLKRALVKMAQDTQTGDDEGNLIQGSQGEMVPELLQPDKGPGRGPRGEEETMTAGSEDEAEKNRMGYLKDAFTQFDPDAKKTGNELRGLLDGFGPKAIVSKAQAEDAATKTGSARLGAFSDELKKIYAAAQ